MTTFTQSNRALGAKKTFKLILAAMLMMIGLQAKAEKKVYTEFVESTGTLTYYYDDQMDSRSGIVEEYDPKISEHFRSYDTGKITKAVVDKSMKEAPLTNMTRLFSSYYTEDQLYALTSIEGLENLNTANVTSEFGMGSMFAGCSSLTSLDLSSFNTANVTYMAEMFKGCSALTALNLSSFNTAKVMYMSDMFSGCSSLTSLDLSSFNTAKVESMHDMFRDCSSLTSLNLSRFNTAQTLGMEGMFAGCSSLTSLDFSSFNTDKVVHMDGMFEGCSSLTSLNLSNFNTEKVTNMDGMFDGCSALTSLDLSNFTVEKLTTATSMFANCGNLTTVICNSDWSTYDFKDDDMFKGCNKLVGGKGSACDGKNHIDKSYARPDFGSVIPGYFTSDIDAPIMVYTEFVESTGTLTYYYDDKLLNRTGVLEEYNPYVPSNRFDSYANKIIKAVIDKSMKDAPLTSMTLMFSSSNSKKHLIALASIEGLDNLNTADVTDMSSMFEGCSALTSLNLSNFNTAKVKNMESMFKGCSSLTSLDLSNFTVEKLTTATSMFTNCGNLTAIICNSDWSTYDFKDDDMFKGCNKLRGCRGTICDGKNHIDKSYARPDFGGAFPGYFTSDIEMPKLLYTMFDESTGTLTYYYDNLYNSHIGILEEYDPKISEHFRSYDTGKITKAVVDKSMKEAPLTNMTMLFSSYYTEYQLYALTSIEGLENLNTANVTSEFGMGSMFAGCSSLTSLDFSSFNTANVTYMAEMFKGCSALTALNLSSFNTAKVMSMWSMFEGCSSLTSLDLSSFNTAKVESMHDMFRDCSSLTSLNLNRFNTAQTLEMEGMFAGCSSLTSLDFSSFNTDKVVHMDGMFEGCSSLTSLNLIFFNTTIVMSMNEMFKGCSSLTTLDLSNFKTAKVTNMDGMFYGCSALTSLDLSNFTVEKLTTATSMFANCGNLTAIICNSDWSTYDFKDDDMFKGCNKLVGGKGSACDGKNHIDKSYARPDGGPGHLGYFTYKVPTLVYSEFVESTGTVTYYYDDQMNSRTGVVEEYNFEDTKIKEKHFSSYADKIVKIVINPSMKDAKLTSTSYMFRAGGSESLNALISIEGMENLNTAYVTDMSYMFQCPKLASLDLSHLTTSNVKKMNYMFQNCISLKFLDVSNFDITKVETMPWMFASCVNLVSIYCNDEWNKSRVLKDGEGMFAGCVKLRGGKGTVYNTSNIDRNYARPDAGRGAPGYFTKREAGKVVYSVFDEKSGTLTYYYDDKRFDENERPGIKEEFDPSSAYLVRFVGYNDKVLAVHIDSSIKEAELLSTSGMFRDLNHAKTIEGIENLNTAKVQDMSYMFYDCRALKELDLSAFNTANVTNMSHMFYGCQTLKNLDLSSFNTANVTDMKNMFNGCRFLNNVNLLSFNTEKITNMAGMFASCFSLKEIDLGSFPFTKLRDASSMFAQCGALTTIICSDDWSSNAALLEDGRLFSGCGSLKGSKGTICDGEKNIDKSYARPDGGTERPGYFTPLTEEAIIDGINYLLNNRDHTATVLPLPEGKYEGNLLIPEKVTYYSKEYTVVSIGDNAFKECYNLISLTMESANPPKVGKDAFEGVTDILSVHVPDESKWLYENADGWKDIDEIHISSHVIDGICYELDPTTYFAKVVGLPNGKYKGNIIVPQEIVYEGIKYKVGSIGKYAFARCPELISVSLPSTITDIADFAFLGSPALTTINIPDDNKTYCDIEGIVYSKNKKTLLFYPNGRYGGYEVPEGTLRIEHNVFNGTDLRWMILPESLKEIGSFALDQTNLVWLVSKSTSPAVAEEAALYGVNKQIPVYVPEESLEAYQTADEWKEFTNIISGIKRHVQVGDFYYDLYLWNKYADVVGAVNEPSGTLVLLSEIDVDVNTLYGISGSGDENDLVHFTVTGIGKEAFKLDQMNEVIIPGTITSIGMHAFYGCTSLMNVELSEGLEEIKAFAFAKCQKMASIKLPESLVTIGQDALAACGFADVTIPDKVKTIGGYAFEDCKNLKWVEIGTSVRHIGNCAFKNANQLLGVFANGETAPLLGENVFLNCSNLKQVYVPCGALDHYRRVWKQYFQLILNDPISYYYTITATPSEHGTVEVPISDCDHNLTAIPDEGYQFVKWTDGNTDNPRFVETPKENLVFEAVFEPKNYRWLVESSNDEWGYVSSPKTLEWYPYNTEMIAIAVPKDGYKFIKWNDGYMNTPYNFNLTKDTYLRAIFVPENEEPEIPQFTMQVTAAKIRWWKKDEAFLYSLDIYMDEACTQLFASYLFDKNGYIVAVSLAPKAPSRNWKEEQETEFQYNITGLTPDTKYYFRMKTTDEEGKLIYTDEGNFRTLNSAVYVVIQHIDAIGEVTYTSECGTNIELARESYDALSDENKALVFNYATLVEAEKQYAELEAAAKAAALADAKEQLSAVIADLTTLQLIAQEYGMSETAETLGNAITAATAVLNSDAVSAEEVLSAMWTALMALDDAKDALLLAAQAQFKDALDALLLPDDSEACILIIENAKSAVDELCLDSEKGLAENVEDIMAAGEGIYNQAKSDLEAQRKAEEEEQPTGVESIQHSDVSSQKVLIDGQLYIMYKGQMYNVQGGRVR